MLVGYVRVSKADGSQVLDLQKDALVTAGVDAERIYQDFVSGSVDERPGLNACLKSLRAGDTLVVYRLDRLGRNLKHLVSTIENLRQKDIGFKEITGNVDTTTANGRLVFNIFASLAEFERELLVERTKAGLAAGRARGRIGGAPRKMTKPVLMVAMEAMKDKKLRINELTKSLKISRTTLWNYVNKDGTPKEEATKLLN